MIWLNSADRILRVLLPDNEWVRHGEVVLSTDPKLPVGTPVKAGDRLALGRRTVVVLRQT
jgi:glycogen operon protein